MTTQRQKKNKRKVKQLIALQKSERPVRKCCSGKTICFFTVQQSSGLLVVTYSVMNITWYVRTPVHRRTLLQ